MAYRRGGFLADLGFVAVLAFALVLGGSPISRALAAGSDKSIAQQVPAASSPATERAIVSSPKSDYFGHDYDILKGADRNLCETACLADSRCKAFTLNESKGWCFLKDDVGQLRASAGALSGRIVERGAATVDVAAERAAELAFLPKSSIEGARRLALKIKGEERDATLVDADLERLAEQAYEDADYAKAESLYREALKRDPEDAAAWAGLAGAALAFASDDYQVKLDSDALRDPAAINAYLYAADDAGKADALDLLAQGMGARDEWKMAIRTGRASLAIAEVEDVRKRLDDAVAAHGFRIVDNSIDNNAANPRICLNFSEELAPAVTASETAGDFVSVDGGETLPVSASGTQICVDGVAHGARYRIVARAGIPSAGGETLAKAVETTVYVRDRDPTVRFSGNAYVLPSGGDVSIPVTTINTTSLEARLLRIGDRELARTIGDSRFLHEMASYDLDTVADSQGEEVWKGFVDVAQKTNEDVTTAIPVAAILKERKPGVYVLAAKAVNGRGDEEALATQWFVMTDIGITSLAARDGFHVFVRSLGTAEPLAGVRLELVAANNEILGTVTSDASGHARLSAGLLAGTGGDKPAVLMASRPDAGAEATGAKAPADFAFLDMTAAPFDLTDRGVDGREPAGALDVFLTSERGIYRTGDTAFMTALVRDGAGEAVPGLTLTGIVTRPDGVEFLRAPLTDGGAGGLSWPVTFPVNAMRGNWSFALYTDPKRPALAQKSVRVDDFEPQKIDFDLSVPDRPIDPATPPEISLDVRYLFGAPAAGLEVSGETVLQPADGIAEYPGYRFGLASDAPTPTRLAFTADATNESGKTTIAIDPIEQPATTKPMTASLQVRVTDASGRPVERHVDRPLLSGKARIGAKPRFDGAVPEGTDAGFDLVALDAAGKRTDLSGAQWTLNKVTVDFQWYQTNGRWNYEPVNRTARVANGTIALGSGDVAQLSLPVGWGGYELVVKDPAGKAIPVGVSFEAGYYVAARSLETPDILKVSLDRPRYKVGDKARVHIEPRFAGKADVFVMDERVVATVSADIPAAGGDVTLDVTRDWGPGAYVTAVLYRPMDLDEKRMPSRAIGLVHAGVEPGERALAVTIDAPQKIAPRRTVAVSLGVDGVKAGEQAYVTLAAVDVGILNITGFEPPSPKGFYFGQRKLGVEIRDLYSRLIDRMQGAPGSVRSGGDAGADAASPPPMDALVALYSGVVTVGPDGKANVSLDIPDFNGTLKLMALAWTKTAVGEASTDMLVRDPIVSEIGRPAFLGPGDRSRIAIDVAHVEGPAGRVQLSLSGGAGTVRIEGNAFASLDVAEGQRQRILVPLTGETPGDAAMELAVTTPDGAVLTKRFTIAVRDLSPETAKASSFEIAAKGGKLTLSDDLLSGFKPASARATVSITGLGGFDVAGIVQALDRYPFGCTEQLTSRALPLVYLDQTILLAGLSGDDDVRKRVDAAIRGVLANQSSNGSFGLWGPESGDLWLDAYVTDFLTRAKEAGYGVPQEALTIAVDNLRNQINYLPEAPDFGPVTYAYYVLARNGRAAIGDLRYTADTLAGTFKTPLAKAHLGAALALYGDRVRAETLFAMAVKDASAATKETVSRDDYGSTLRDGASVLTLGLEAAIDGVDFAPLVKRIDLDRAARTHTSTQEDAWSLLAAHAAATGRPPSLVIDGKLHDGAYASAFDAAALARPVVIENRGDAPVSAKVTVSGVPLTAPPPDATGFSIKRSYYTLEGKPADPATIAQGLRLVAVVEVLPADGDAARIIVDDPLPAGFEIDNPALLRGGDVASLGFLELTGEVAHTEFRADRFVASVNKAAGNTDTLRFAYIVRAVSPGEFVHPAAIVEDMYRPERRGRTDEGHVTVVGPLR